MEIRLIYGSELQWAVYTANEVFGRCVRPHVRSEEEIRKYQSYMQIETLWQEMCAGKLFLWGAFENGQMCAVGAMQNTGQITMLYVLPQHGGRHIASRILDEMCGYAASLLGRERVTLRVSMASPVQYFYHVGFRPVSDTQGEDGSMLLERRIWTVPWQGYQNYAGAGNPGYGNMYGAGMPGYGGMANTGWGAPGYAGYGNVPQKPKKPEVTYPVRKVKPQTVLWLTLGTLLLVTAITVGITVHHMVKDGLMTEADYWDEEYEDDLFEGMGEPVEI